jgi:8-oxo-dGTP diphosphatase
MGNSVTSDFERCPICRTPLTTENVDGLWRPFCPTCKNIVRLSPKLVAATLVGNAEGLLLIQRSYGAEKGLWAPPGGYVEQGEVVEEAACREAYEETGLKVTINGLVGLYSEPGRPIVLAAFSAEAVGGALHDLSPEVQNVGFFPVDDLPPLAFPKDRGIIETWVQLQETLPPKA